MYKQLFLSSAAADASVANDTGIRFVYREHGSVHVQNAMYNLFFFIASFGTDV